jgi:hypothetical protein
MAAYPRTDIGLDHNPLIGTLKFRGKRQIRTRYMISVLSDTRK